MLPTSLTSRKIDRLAVVDDRMKIKSFSAQVGDYIQNINNKGIARVV